MSDCYIVGNVRINPVRLDEFFSRYEILFKKHARILVHSQHPLPQIIALHLCRKYGQSLFLCPSHFRDDAVQKIARQYAIGMLLHNGDAEGLEMSECSDNTALDPNPGIFIFTTGTTGSPKLVQHSWGSIAAASDFVGERLKGKVWLMTYATTGYAGLQVFFSAMRQEGTLVYMLDHGFEAYARAIQKYDVKIVSATPTFWRLLMNAWPRDLSPAKLDQATIGGEIVTQDILDMVKRFFRPEKLTHIYASTEVGTAIVVSDGQAGFPACYLNDNRSVKLRINNQVLEVHSPSRMKTYVGQGVTGDEGWISTGDVVEDRGNRYVFVGRNDGRINVGGNKVLPEEVESSLLALRGVLDCVVYEKKNPVVGALLASDIVLSDKYPCSISEIKRELLKHVPDYKVPQYIRFVKGIAVSGNGKKIRR